MYDLVIRNGTIIDGTGMPRYRGDVAIAGNRIAAIGRISQRGKEELDATGHVVSPGFIDGHTHMDAQMFWDPLGTCPCWHGITTVIMGNCGFTLAPGKPSQRDMVLSNLVRSEDISLNAINASVEWTWTTFRDYMNVIDKLPKAINYAANVGHSALRTYVMGERAFGEKATGDDLRAMESELLDALDAGAIGLTTSCTASHKRPDDGVVASYHASWDDELAPLVCAMGNTGHGIFEISRGKDPKYSPDPAVRKADNDRLMELAVKSSVPITFGLPSGALGAQDMLKSLDAAAEAGGRMFGQTHTRGASKILSFEGRLPFDVFPEWAKVRALPVEEQRKAFSDPATRKRLVEATQSGGYRTGGGEARAPQYENMYILRSAVSDNPTVAEIAAQRNVDPVEVMMDLALETNFNQLFQQFDKKSRPKNDAEALATLRHPWTVLAFSDSGAHVKLNIDSSLHTQLLAYWVREKQAFSLEEAVHMITLKPAMAWRLVDRGLIRQGCIADLNVFDPATVGPELPTYANDLPAGERRLKQKSKGILATILAGKVTFKGSEHTGALSGKLLRSSVGGVL